MPIIIDIEGGVEAEGNNVLDVLRNVGILGEHNVRTDSGNIYFVDSKYPYTASVKSRSLKGLFIVRAHEPSFKNAYGLARPELVEKE